METNSIYRAIKCLYGEDTLEDITQMAELIDKLELGDLQCYKFDEIDASYRDLYMDFMAAKDQLEAAYEYYVNPPINESDYDNAVLETMGIPSDRELCILRLAREAVDSSVNMSTITKFFRTYGLDCAEQQIFYTEYWSYNYSRL